MKPDVNRVLLQSGIGSILAGALLLLAPGANLAQAHAAKTRPFTAPICSHQRNLNNPTNTSHSALLGYWFSVNHQGNTAAFCTLSGNVHAGDIVTAHVTVTSPAPAGLEVTLLTNIAPAATPKNQSLFDCASYGVAPDPASTSDTCLAVTAPTMTVNVPACGFQVDLIYGEPITPEVEGQYSQTDRWIDGGAAKASTVCPPASTPSPSPGGGGGVGGVTATPSRAGGGGGVQALSTPSTGASLGGDAPIGILLIAAGAGATAFAARRRRADIA